MAGEGKKDDRGDIGRALDEIDRAIDLAVYAILRLSDAASLLSQRKKTIRVAKPLKIRVEDREWCRGVLTELKIVLEKGDVGRALELVKKALEEVGETNPRDL